MEDVSGRRAFSRTHASFEVRLRVLGDERVARAIDRSSEGIRIVCTTKLRVGDELEVAAPYIKNANNTFVPARVVWVRPMEIGAGEIGLELLSKSA